MSDKYAPDRAMIVWKGENWLDFQVTMLLLVVIALELSDIVFAIDSCGSKLAQIPDPFMAFSSTVIAMYGLRAMFFVIAELEAICEYLKYGICIILVFIGLELIFSDKMNVSSGTVCGFIMGIFFGSIAISLISWKFKGSDAEGKDKDAVEAVEDKTAKPSEVT